MAKRVDRVESYTALRHEKWHELVNLSSLTNLGKVGTKQMRNEA